MSRSGKDRERVRFGDVVRLVADRCDPVAEGVDRFVGLEHLEPGNLRVRSWGLVEGGTTFTNRFRPGQVLFGKRRAYQKKVAVADFEGVCSGDIYVFESSDEARLYPDLLPFLCQTDAFFEHAVGTSAGSLSPRTNWSQLADYEFVLPPMEEQRRLADQMVAATSTAGAFDSVCKQAETLRRAVLIQAFRPDRGPHDCFPSHWRREPMSVAGNVQLGQRRHPGIHTGSNVRPYLRVANVYDGELDLSSLNTMHFPEHELSKYELLPGDILLNEGQSADLVGRSAIYRGEIPGVCFQMTLLRFRCSDRLIPEFAHAYFQHMLYTGQFARVSVQTTSMAHLTGVRFEKLPMPIPPMKEQRKVVDQVTRLMEARRSARARADAARSLARRSAKTLGVC